MAAQQDGLFRRPPPQGETLCRAYPRRSLSRDAPGAKGPRRPRTLPASCLAGSSRPQKGLHGGIAPNLKKRKPNLFEVPKPCDPGAITPPPFPPLLSAHACPLHPPSEPVCTTYTGRHEETLGTHRALLAGAACWLATTGSTARSMGPGRGDRNDDDVGEGPLRERRICTSMVVIGRGPSSPTPCHGGNHLAAATPQTPDAAIDTTSDRKTA